MPDVSFPHPSDPLSSARLADLEARLHRIETHLGLAPAAASPSAPPSAAAPLPVAARPARVEPQAQSADEFEVEVGQTWFARVGILVFALGGGYMLTLPYPGLTPLAPPLAGIATAGLLLGVAHYGQSAFDLVARYLRGAGMALLYCATLRFFFFGAPPALTIDSALGPVLLWAAVGINLALALHRDSPWLTGLTLLCGAGTLLAIGSAGGTLVGLGVISLLAVWLSVRREWPAVVLFGVAVVFGTYLLWAAGNPIRGGDFKFTTSPSLAPACLLLYVLVFGLQPLFRPARGDDDVFSIGGALAVCGLGYATYLVHTLAAFPKEFATAHLGAVAVYTVIAVALWTRRHSPISTFLHVMTGSAALSAAILKFFPTPDVFVWLSLQSVAVVATAIAFRSRSIVVANFLIYLAVVLAYIFVKKTETGISVGFGIVALISARILNWKKHRLELKTELMRNAYLLSAFVIFPYALYHLVPPRVVGLAWIGMALVYYILNFAVQNRKYRWMGHGTLLLTAIFLLLAGSRQLDPTWRIISFLALGAVMLIASLAFTRLRRRENAPSAT
ncbi:MAG: DUF2339 domain-containing protein [Verrucomicrobia bacterium]|nr:DUF2339 domain-containing protein [Verrucomicrobiota bacterium]